MLIVTSIQFVFPQVVVIDPSNPNTDSNVTLTYDATLGNGELAGFEGDVYIYTGVITTSSTGPNDWKYVRNNWGEVNPSALMTPLGNDHYEISFHIRDFYGIPENEEVLQLAMLFHNADYTIVGRSETNNDIYVDINIQTVGDYLGYSIVGETLEIELEGGIIETTYFAPAVVKTEFIPSGADVSDTSFTVVGQPLLIEPDIEETTDALSFRSSEMEVFITKEPVRMHYIFNGDTLLQHKNGFVRKISGGEVSFKSEPDESFYGGGSRAIEYNRKGKNLKIYNEAHYGYSNNTPTLNISIPFVVSGKNYGLFFDNRYPSYIDLGSNDLSETVYTTDGDRLRYYFMAGNDQAEVLEHYTYLTGRQKLPPLWVLGYIQSKYGYENETNARNMVNELIDQDFPLDALILDLYWYGTTNDMGNLDWDESLWPQPVDMMNDFSDLGVKTILISQPYVTTNSVNFNTLAENDHFAWNEQGDPFVLYGFWAGDAALIDFTQTETHDWMWSFYQDRIQEGVSGWWCDLGEPETHPWEMQHQFGEAKSVHNVFSLIWARFLDQKYQENYPDERLFNLIRSGYAGMQRYSTFPWSGDIQRSFDGLRAQIPLMLGAGMSGLGYMHSDVGGFVGNDGDAELFTRWVQFGVFAPILRLHGVGTTEPVRFPEPYRSITRDYINLRYHLLPYNYTLAYENSMYGWPLARPLNFYDSTNEMLENVNNAYLWGKDLLVVPVLNYNVNQVSFPLPEGNWFDYHSGELFEGGQMQNAAVTLNDIPLLVRGGAFIPTIRNIQNTTAYSTDSLIVKFYPDNSTSTSSGYFYDDDGTSTQTIDNGNYRLINFEGTLSGNSELAILLTKEGTGYESEPDARNFLFEIFNMGEKPSQILVDGIPVDELPGMDYMNGENSWLYDPDKSKLFVNVNFSGSQQSIVIEEAVVSSVYEPIVNNLPLIIHPPFPNPFESKLTLPLSVGETDDYNITVEDISGRIVYRHPTVQLIPGVHHLELELSDEMATGVYMVRIRSSEGRQAFKKIIRR